MCAKSLQISKWEIFLALSPLSYISAGTEVTSFLTSQSMIALFEFELTKYVCEQTFLSRPQIQYFYKRQPWSQRTEANYR